MERITQRKRKRLEVGEIPVRFSLVCAFRVPRGFLDDFYKPFFLFSLLLVPGKPPQNLSAHATSTTSIRVKWNNVQDDSDISLFRIFYITTGQQNETISRTDVNASITSVDITNLGKFVNYTVWVRSISSRGPGTESFPIYVKTLEEGEHNDAFK